MLPHLADRPLNLQRFPNGAGAPGFWQKDIPETAPKWLTRWHETGVDGRDGPRRQRPPHRGPRRRAVLARQPGELRDPRLDRPPARPVATHVRATSTSTPARRPPGTRPSCSRGSTGRRWGTSASAAIRRRPASAASRSGSRSSRSTSSARPAPGSSGSRARSGATVPDLISWEWAKEARKGRARLDYTQNASIKTLVAPYCGPPGRRRARSPRRSPGTSSTTRTCARTAGRSATIIERVEQVGDLFAAAQTDAQELPKV